MGHHPKLADDIEQIALYGTTACDMNCAAENCPTYRIKIALAELEAVRVLDAWAKKHEEATPPTPLFHKYMGSGRWPILMPGGIEHFDSAAEARIAAADALVKEDPILLEGL